AARSRCVARTRWSAVGSKRLGWNPSARTTSPRAGVPTRSTRRLNQSHQFRGSRRGSRMTDARGDVILEVRNLVKHFQLGGGFLGREPAVVKAVDNVSFEIRRGETLGLVGESGCGKTTTGRCVLQLERATSGQVIFEGRDLTTLSDSDLRQVRR